MGRIRDRIGRWAQREADRRQAEKAERWAKLEAELLPPPSAAVVSPTAAAPVDESVNSAIGDLIARTRRPPVLDEGEGWTDEGRKMIREMMATYGLSYPEAAKAVERMYIPEPIMSGGGWQALYRGDRKAEEANAEAMQALLDGDDETFLRHHVPAIIASVRGS